MSNFLSYAFRPFFLLNGIFAVVALAIWVSALHGTGPATLPVNINYWHGHEMMVGFVMAAIAGFILTAVATWTGRPALQGGLLALLVLAWLVGRLAMGMGGVLPSTWVAVLDMLFPVLLIVFVAREVFGGGSKRNYPVVLITVLLALFNFLYHASELGLVPLAIDADRIALYLMIHLALLLITVIAGRIVPSFTANWMRAQGQVRLPQTSVLLDRLSILLTVSTGLFASIAPVSLVTGYLAFAAALVHGLRLSRWRGLATTSEPLLFVLHAGYFWLPLGYALLGCSIFGWLFPATAALHALTMGATGFMVLAVTTRVALAHTGRKLHVARLTVCAYWILFIAIVLRVLSPFTGNYLMVVDIAATGWMLAFGIFTWVYWPVLTGPHVGQDD
ncbi:MAG: NnrS family protein [Gammaproteobacteria bacterium]|nr:MAG: NnrS family protein [Gammaproteobacteria bacterium]